MFNCLKNLLFISLLGLVLPTYAGKQISNQVADLTHQEAVLWSCLNVNYSKLGLDLKDYSGNHYSYQTQIKLSDFVVKEAGSFYQENLPLHLENSKPPYTKIFARCVHFSRSAKVKKFLKKLDLGICEPKSVRSDCPFYQ